MNTFAVLLLAFPFYLAVNNRLVAYTSLVTKQPTSSGTSAQQSGVQPLPTL